MANPEHWSHAIVARLGGHPSGGFGIDLGSADGIAGWFVLALLLGGRNAEVRGVEAYRALLQQGLGNPTEIAKVDPRRLSAVLEEAGTPKPEPIAAVLYRVCEVLTRRHGGSPAALLDGADDLTQAGERLVSLAPGFGPGAALRFLRPLRDHWPAAREVPLAASARAAAVHLGLIRDGEDEEGEPGALRATLRNAQPTPDLADVEAALERLGARSCLRNQPARCPLGDQCPTRTASD